MKKEVQPSERKVPSLLDSPRESFLVHVSPAEHGQRVDHFIAQKLEGVGRKLAGRLCESGQVRVDDRRVRKSFCLSAGQEVCAPKDPSGRALPAPSLPLTIVFSSPELVIVNKDPGIPSAALPEREEGTMAGALLARFPEMRHVGFGPREPGIVHRLDNQTSGLLLAARTQVSFLALRKAISGGQIEKRYLALVESGRLPKSGTVELALCNDRKNRKQVRLARENEGHPCRTDFRIIESSHRFDLIEARASAAFRHQIRFHLASIGAPLVGDILYGGLPTLAPRHALHASYIRGRADNVPEFLAESKLPEDLRRVFEDPS